MVEVNAIVNAIEKFEFPRKMLKNTSLTKYFTWDSH